MNFEICYNFMLDNEDRLRLYKTVPDSPEGAFAISGINSASFPAQFNIINAIPQNQRGLAIEEFYREHFWNDYFEQINSVDLVMRVFDSCVNMGKGEGIILLQTAINSCIPNLTSVDGGLGPHTDAAANEVIANSSFDLVAEFKTTRAQFYKNLVIKNPDDEKYLTGWLARAMK